MISDSDPHPDAERGFDADSGAGSWDDAEVGRAPICAACGVTALPADPTTVVDTRFVCENPDCEAFGEEV
ncbi:MAG: hypothetical protein U5R31_09980 [Acidimicrobiia bacterium]|nr:hypothetical protein [Acidimicrobiia bacterium]